MNFLSLEKNSVKVIPKSGESGTGKKIGNHSMKSCTSFRFNQISSLFF